MITQTQNIALDDVKQKVAHWRANKNSPSEQMLQELRTFIGNLVPLYSINNIANVLKIKPATIQIFYKRYCLQQSPNNEINFVPI